VVVSVAGKEVTPEQTLSFIVANTAPGKRIPIELVRNGQRLTVNAVVDKRPTEEELAKQSFDPDAQDQDDSFGGKSQSQKQNGTVIQKSLGLAAIPLTTQIARQLGASDDTRGVVVTAVDDRRTPAPRGCSAATSSCRPTTALLTSIADLEAVVRAAKAENREAVLLRVQRRGQPAIYVPVRLR
jgi:serine protease Do